MELSAISSLLVIIASCLLLVLIIKVKPIVNYLRTVNNKSDIYSAVIFISVSISSLILIIFGAFNTVDDNTILNSILLTITSITIAIFLDRVGILSEIRKKVDSININDDKLRSRREVESIYPLKERWKNAKKVIVITTTASSLFLGASKEIIDEALSNDTELIFITLKPNSAAWEDYFEYKMNNKVETNKRASESVPNTIKNDYHGKITYYQTKISIPYALMYVEKHIESDSFVKVDLYSIGVKEGDRPCMIFYKNDPYFEFFKEQANNIINISKKDNEHLSSEDNNQ